jgi:hypothetical protein
MTHEWDRKMQMLDGALTGSGRYADYRGNKSYSQKHISGLIGEREGRKWLEEKGYEVHEFQQINWHFKSISANASEILKVLSVMKRRRKQDYVEKDRLLITKHKQNIVREVSYLKGLFGERYFGARHLFTEIDMLRSYICHNKNRRGSRQPDFIVKKRNEFAFVEVKANTSDLVVEQRGCFKLAQKYGFNAYTLKVIVKGNVVKNIGLLPYDGRKQSIEVQKADLALNQYEAIIEAFNVLGGTRSVTEIKNWVTSTYGFMWKDFYVLMLQMASNRLNSSIPEKYRVLSKVSLKTASHERAYAYIYAKFKLKQ